MPLDNTYYEKYISIFREEISKIFNHDMIEISYEENFKNRGYFQLVLKYLPFQYFIVIENEFRTFDIIIKDSEGAANALYRINHFDNRLDENNISKSLSLLKSVLEQNGFNLYLCINDKVYRKNANGIKRVKDLKELRNG